MHGMTVFSGSDTMSASISTHIQIYFDLDTDISQYVVSLSVFLSFLFISTPVWFLMDKNRKYWSCMILTNTAETKGLINHKQTLPGDPPQKIGVAVAPGLIEFTLTPNFHKQLVVNDSEVYMKWCSHAHMR